MKSQEAGGSCTTALRDYTRKCVRSNKTKCGTSGEVKARQVAGTIQVVSAAAAAHCFLETANGIPVGAGR